MIIAYSSLLESVMHLLTNNIQKQNIILIQMSTEKVAFNCKRYASAFYADIYMKSFVKTAAGIYNIGHRKITYFIYLEVSLALYKQVI